MNATATHPPQTLHGLPVLTPAAATATGHESITNNICAATEPKILAGVCQWRNPDRCCLAWHGEHIYQLCILREDIRGDATDTD